MALSKQQYPFAATSMVKVAQFMRAFDQRIPRFWEDHDASIRPLRKQLITEEFDEFINAKNKIAMLDGLCDLLYVTLGSLLALGYRADLFQREGLEQPLPAAVGKSVFQLSQQPCQRLDGQTLANLTSTVIAVGERMFGVKQFRGAFYAVHDNNMQKLWTRSEFVQAGTGEQLTAKTAVGQETNERCLIVRRPDGKVVKPPGFLGVNLEKFTSTIE